VKRRLFVAAALDEASRGACAAVAERLRARGWPGRWIAPEGYHLTVAFLGGVAEERVGEVEAAIADVAPRLEPLNVPLDAVGAFPGVFRPRVAWVGSKRPVPAFGTLCGVVRGALVASGFSFDPHNDPHVTLARADGSTRLPAVAPPRTVVPVDALTVYESITGPSGARYQPLARVRLGSVKQPSA
jgi:RNA 2',3'-cyclic 3'-phosphodiesterase